MSNKRRNKVLKGFIGSSKEALDAAKAIQNNLQYNAFTSLWTQDIFKLSLSTLENLIKDAPTNDFAVLILSPDDVTDSRDVKKPSPRDNVIFEAGLLTGILGRERVFLVKRRDVEVKLPSDLLDITMAEYTAPPHEAKDKWESALGPASNKIIDALKDLTPLSSARRTTKTSQEQLKSAAQYFDKLLIGRYGVSMAVNSVSLTVTDLKGTATLRRGLQGIKVIDKGGVKIDKIPGMVASSTRGSKIIKYPSFINKKFPKAISMQHRVKKLNVNQFDIVIKGSLTQFDPALDVGYESTVSKFFLMTKEEVEKTYAGKDFPYEYIALRMEMPTTKTVLEISFPEGYSVDLHPGVFFGESESMHDSELYKVRKGFKKTRRGARFTISKPLIGFNYLIYWESPSKQDFDKLKPKM